MFAAAGLPASQEHGLVGPSLHRHDSEGVAGNAEDLAMGLGPVARALQGPQAMALQAW